MCWSMVGLVFLLFLFSFFFVCLKLNWIYYIDFVLFKLILFSLMSTLLYKGERRQRGRKGRTPKMGERRTQTHNGQCQWYELFRCCFLFSKLNSILLLLVFLFVCLFASFSFTWTSKALLDKRKKYINEHNTQSDSTNSTKDGITTTTTKIISLEEVSNNAENDECMNAKKQTSAANIDEIKVQLADECLAEQSASIFSNKPKIKGNFFHFYYSLF
jgi:hypothetical protein